MGGQVKLESQKWDHITPFQADGITTATGLSVPSDFSVVVVLDATMTTCTVAADTDQTAVFGTVYIKELSTSGRYTLRHKLPSSAGSFRMDVDIASLSQRYSVEYEVVPVLDIDAAANQTRKLVAQDNLSVGLAFVDYTVKSSSGVTMLSGRTDESGEADMFLPAGTNYAVTPSRADKQFSVTTFSVVEGSNANLVVTATTPSISFIAS